jgi:hypothetical protein
LYFVSIHRNFTFPDIRRAKPEFTPKGELARIIPDLSAQFVTGGAVPDYARDAVSKLPGFLRGIGLDEDPYTRVGWFDSVVAQEANGWTDAERKEVEDALIAAEGLYFVRADQPKLSPPWPAYDNLKAQGKRTAAMVAEKIVERVVEDGYDVGQVLAYETQNLNRREVIAALEALVDTEPESVEETVAA